MTVSISKKIAVGVLGLVVAGVAASQENAVNVYSGRHYQTDEALYAGFTKATGIKVNRIEAGEDAIIERIRNEGARSPADVMITVDAGRLWRAVGLCPAALRAGQRSTVTRVPIGVYGQTFAAAASGSSTQPRLCGVPKDARLNAWIPSPPLK